MASTNQTTNYKLSQYIGTDKPTYLGDYNGDMLKIDTQMKKNADASVNATSDAGSALSKATEVEKSVKNLEKTVAEQTTNISNLESSDTSISANVSTVMEMSQNNQNSVNQLNTQMTAVQKYKEWTTFTITNLTSSSAPMKTGAYNGELGLLYFNLTLPSLNLSLTSSSKTIGKIDLNSLGIHLSHDVALGMGVYQMTGGALPYATLKPCLINLKVDGTLEYGYTPGDGYNNGGTTIKAFYFTGIMGNINLFE